MCLNVTYFAVNGKYVSIVYSAFINKSRINFSILISEVTIYCTVYITHT